MLPLRSRWLDYMEDPQVVSVFFFSFERSQHSFIFFHALFICPFLSLKIFFGMMFDNQLSTNEFLTFS